MKLYNDIDLVQINIREGVDEYYLPKNVNWRERVIDKILVVTAPLGTTVLSPIDGQTQVLDESIIDNMYFDLYAADDTQICRSVQAANFFHLNNNPLNLGYKLSLNLSRIFFSQAPETAGCILLYFFYGTKECEDEQPIRESVTVQVPLTANGRMSLQDIVDNYIYMQPRSVKGIYLWNWDDAPCYLTLRYADNIHVLNYLFSSLCRPPMLEPLLLYTSQTHSMFLDNIDINMLNSYVQNAQNTEITVSITFLY